MKNILLISILLAGVACTKKSFSPPVIDNNSSPSFLIEKNISYLYTLLGNNSYQKIDDNIIISGTVIANDKSGNFYKQIIIDDGTAAIPIQLDAFNLYNKFPIGRKVYIKCKNLNVVSRYRLVQLAFSASSNEQFVGIPYLLWGNYIYTDSIEKTSIPISVRLDEINVLKKELLSRLVIVNDVQINDLKIDSTYALAPEITSASNILIRDCDSNLIILRNSAYSNFRHLLLPKGRGSIVAIYATYNNSPQLIIRDTNDVKLYLQPCTK